MMFLSVWLLAVFGTSPDSISATDSFEFQWNARASAFFVDANFERGGGDGSANELFYAPTRLQLDDVEKLDIAYATDTRFFFTAMRPEQQGAPSVEIGWLPALNWAAPYANSDLTLLDTGSYLSLRKALGIGSLGATIFPRQSRQIRIGYTEVSSWLDQLPRSYGVPGARLEWTYDEVYAFAAGSTFERQMDQPNGTLELGTAWQTVAGAGAHLFDLLWVDVEGTYANRGTIDRLGLRVSAEGKYNVKAWRAAGGAFRLGLGQGDSLATPVNYRPFENDLYFTDSLVARRAKPASELGWSVVATGTYLGQTLQDAVQPNKTTWQKGLAGTLIAKARWRHLQATMAAGYRDLAFVLFSVPSNPNYMDLPPGITVNPEKRVSVGAAADWSPGDLPFTTAIDAGVVWPANTVAATPVGTSASDTTGGFQQKLVFHSPYNVTILGPGEKVEPLVEARLALRAPISTWLMAAVEILDQYDRNRRKMSLSADGFPVRVQAKPNTVGINLILRASL